MPVLLQNIYAMITDPFIRYCFLNGITEAEKERIVKLALENPFSAMDIAHRFVANGNDFEKLNKELN